MKIVDNKVEYTDREQETVERLAWLLSTMKMKPIPAYREALAGHGAKPAKQFVEHLSQGTLTMDGNEIVKKEPEPEPEPETAA